MGTAEKILACAGTEFAQHGLDGARVDRIASRAGVNKAMIYYHFRSKEDLYRTVIDRQIGKIRRLVEETISGETTPESAFRRLSELYHLMFEEGDSFVPMFLREVAGGSRRLKALLADIISERKSLAQQARKFIDNGEKKGMLRNVDSRHAMISFMGMNMGYLIMAPLVNLIWEIKDEKKFRKERPEEVVDLFLQGLKARDK